MATISQLQQLLNIIPNSKQNAMHADDIARALGLPTTGTCEATRALIREANLNGYFIVNTIDDGFWLTSNKQDVLDYLGTLSNRIQGTQGRINALKAHWNSAHPNNIIP